MCEKFCILKKDKKTFKILEKYIFDIKNNIDLLKTDNSIQAQEIIDHLFLSGKDAHDWVLHHAKKERIYLNTIKELAVLFVCTDREITLDNFEFFVDKLNIINECILKKIY